jgi:phosphoglycolate phosphatase-like HAD superfamily hydrolase
VFRVLALDFDGVISDSAPECFVTALRTYLALVPEGPLAKSGASVPGPGAPTPDEVRGHGLYARFREAMPLGNRAEDFGVALAAIEAGRGFVDQAAYDRFAATVAPSWRREFHARFYRVRAALRSADPDGWLRLMAPYPAFLAILRRRAGEVALAIATAKDRESVLRLLHAYAVDDLFPEERVLDKETGVSKAAHLEQLRDGFGCDLGEITFVDDKVNHLDVAAALGVRCALASWGFNGEREIALAQRAGYLVCGLDDVEARLFD